MYTLYYFPGACSLAVHAVLHEINAPHQAINVKGDDEYKKINPRGSVPVLKDDELLIREGAAILVYLLDKHANALLPREGAARARALEWVMFANSTLHPAYSAIFGVQRMYQDKAQQEAVVKANNEKIDRLWNDVEQQLGKSRFIAGNEATVADILLTVIANWSSERAYGENTRRMLKEISQRPSYQKAMQAEKVEYKAAA